MDNTPMLDLARWVRFRWQLQPGIAVGDTKYGTVSNIVGLERDGIRAYLPTSDFSERTGFYSLKDFVYDAVHDRYLCPQGQELPLYVRRKSEQVLIYRANKAICNACPLKAKCTDSKSSRHLFRSFFHQYIDRAIAYSETPAFKKAMRKRQVWVEPLFGEAKQWHGLAKFRLRGIENVNIEGLITAAGQNLKRLLACKTMYKPNKPAGTGAVMAALPPPRFFLSLN